MINDLYFLIAGVIAQIFDLNAGLVIPIGTLTNEANAEMETHQILGLSNAFCSSIHYVLFHLKGNFFFHLCFSLNSKSNFFFHLCFSLNPRPVFSFPIFVF